MLTFNYILGNLREFDGDYDTIIGNNKVNFLLEACGKLSPVGVIDVVTNNDANHSIIVTVKGFKSDIIKKKNLIKQKGLHLPSFQKIKTSN